MCGSTKYKRHVNAVDHSNSSESETDLISSVELVNDVNSDDRNKPIYTDIAVNGQQVSFQVDPGATANIIPHKHVNNIHLEPTTSTLKMWNGVVTTHHIGKGRIDIRNIYNRRKYNVDFLGADNDYYIPFLGRETVEAMNLITVNYENLKQVNSALTYDPMSVQTILQDYPTIFDRQLVNLPGEVHFYLDETVLPVTSTPIDNLCY